jgi:prepilin-type processing-associated H-X9-DG protein
VRGALLGDQSDWTKVTSYVLYSNNDMPPEKRYLPDNTFSDSTDKSWPVGPWGRTNSNPAASGWMRTQLSMGIDKSKVDANGVEPSLSIIPALYETDGEYPPEGKAKWPWPVPVKAAHDNHINVLFFDWHVAPVPRGSYSPAKM